jgi:hypothetical protein
MLSIPVYEDTWQELESIFFSRIQKNYAMYFQYLLTYRPKVELRLEGNVILNELLHASLDLNVVVYNTGSKQAVYIRIQQQASATRSIIR